MTTDLISDLKSGYPLDRAAVEQLDRDANGLLSHILRLHGLTIRLN